MTTKTPAWRSREKIVEWPRGWIAVERELGNASRFTVISLASRFAGSPHPLLEEKAVVKSVALGGTSSELLNPNF